MTQKTFDAIMFTILAVIAISMLSFAIRTGMDKGDTLLCATLSKQADNYKGWRYDEKYNPGGFYITQFQYDYCLGIGYEIDAPISN